ncbi:MAG TPA: VOC family protein [Parafilimonas sp.]|nr:VOC family protein [Parafilimonas sp.]
MKLDSLIPVLYTENIEATLQFYAIHLHFVCNNYDEDIGWASISNGDIELMLSKPNAHADFTKPVFTGSFYFKVQYVDELWNNLKDKVQVCYPLENFDYGMREFAIHDNNGYLLQFGCEAE